jgi:hypothetical protein
MFTLFFALFEGKYVNFVDKWLSGINEYLVFPDGSEKAIWRNDTLMELFDPNARDGFGDIYIRQ